MTPALARRGFAIGESARRLHLVGGWFVVAVSAVIGLCVLADSSRHFSCHGESKHDIARATAAKYAFEALPSWLTTHPGCTCPDDLADLNEWMNKKDTRDPWGRDYRWACGPLRNQPSLLVVSAGPDGRFGTSDDIGSSP